MCAVSAFVKVNWITAKTNNTIHKTNAPRSALLFLVMKLLLPLNAMDSFNCVSSEANSAVCFHMDAPG